MNHPDRDRADDSVSVVSLKCCKCGSIERYKNGQCAPCNKAAKARWRAENPKIVSERAKAWRIANPEKAKANSADWNKANLGRASANTAAWRVANPGRATAASKKWAEANPEKIKASKAAQYAANPEAFKTRNKNRRARKLKAGGKLSVGISKRLFVLQRGKCTCCSLPLGDNYHLDHIMPLALGGTNTDDNVQLLRQLCNNQKYAKHPIDFMQQRGFLL